MTKEKEILASTIKECKKHLARMEYAHHKVAFLIPLNEKKVEQLKEEEISYLDQYIFRFSKLQDAIGQKLFKAVLTVLGEEMSNKPFIDVFNRLEQLGIAENYALWQELRVVRNETTHEYDEDKQELAEKLTILLKSKDVLKNYLVTIIQYSNNKNLLN